jgi:E3 ubiquitin-protein ligase EDD1
MAVNNLLARDDEGDDDLDDEYVGGKILLSISSMISFHRFLADLISLLDVNPHNEHPGIILESEFFDEADFALRYSNIQRRVVSARIANNASSSLADPALERDRKRNRYDPRWLDGSLREELFGRIDRELKPDDLSLVKDSNTSIRKSQTNPQYQHQHSAPAALINSSSTQNPIVFGDQLQYWTDVDNTHLHFTHIACLHSELIAINTNGQLCQWNWQDDYPYQDLDNPQIKHPKTLTLKLINEKLLNLSANLIRASVLTESNRLATWIDESLGTQVNLKLQHSLQEFPSVHILDIQTSPLYTIFRTDTNDLYWYGLLPYKPRKKLLERLKDKTRHKHRTNSQQQIINIGCSVCLISNPYYNQGAWAFSIRDGQPKLGQLMEQAWILSNTARFRIKTLEFLPAKIKDDDKSSLEMPPPPSPASSTCSVDSNPNFPSTLKRKKHSSTGTNPFLPTINDSDSNEQHSKIKDEEYWPLDEVIFIEDCKVAPIGKVMKIDGSLVLVQFPSKNTDDPNNLENCRILRKDDLQVSTDV